MPAKFVATRLLGRMSSVMTSAPVIIDYFVAKCGSNALCHELQMHTLTRQPAWRWRSQAHHFTNSLQRALFKHWLGDIATTSFEPLKIPRET